MGLFELILLDTHVVIWLPATLERLSSTAAAAIRTCRRDSGVAICSVSLLEMAHLIQRGRIQVDRPLAEFLDAIAHQFVLKHITGKVACAAVQFSGAYPRDPIDRIIGATAMTEHLPLVTADEKIRTSGQVETI